MEEQALLEKIEQSEMILVGLGEDFDGTKRLQQREGYEAGCKRLKAEGKAWLIPAWSEYCLEKFGNDAVEAALDQLGFLLEGKNFFLVSVSTNSKIARMSRAVMPCGSTVQKQCANGCPDVLAEVTAEERERLWQYFQSWRALPEWQEIKPPELGRCQDCDAPLILNTIYAENYNEKGYLPQWDLYMKWLQGTLNHRLLILELGVGMQFPSVIRWPFEKIAFFNKKAYIYRVHGRLYQLTKELEGKGCGISADAVDWLAQL